MLVLSRKSRESVVIGGADGFQHLLKVTVLGIDGGKGFSNRRQEIQGRIENRVGIKEFLCEIVPVIRVRGEDHVAAGHGLLQLICDGSRHPHLSQGSRMNPYPL